jgi:hypothetical protein
MSFLQRLRLPLPIVLGSYYAPDTQNTDRENAYASAFAISIYLSIGSTNFVLLLARGRRKKTHKMSRDQGRSPKCCAPTLREG